MNFESADFDLSENARPIVIAEIGVNHNCDMALARRLVDEAVACGADVVKFQAFIAEEEISRYAPKAEYQKETTGEAGSQLEMAKQLELSHADLKEIKDYCADKNVPFLCSAFDVPSFDFLVKELKVKSVKIASSEVTNLPFLEYIARTGTAMILSTGASHLSEVEQAVAAIRRAGDVELVLLHCVSNYPAEQSELNLSAVSTMREALQLPVGYSDHSEGTLAPAIAVAFGAVAIEKHFTLDRSLPGPDHRASIEPGELKAIVENVHTAYLMRGNGVKVPVPCEQANRQLIRKSIVAAHPLKQGVCIQESDLKYKRPATGMAPGLRDVIVGKVLNSDVDVDQPLMEDYFHG